MTQVCEGWTGEIGFSDVEGFVKFIEGYGSVDLRVRSSFAL